MKDLIVILLFVSFENARGCGGNNTAIRIRGVGKNEKGYFSTKDENRIIGRKEPEVTRGSRSFEIRPGSY